MNLKTVTAVTASALLAAACTGNAAGPQDDVDTVAVVPAAQVAPVSFDAANVQTVSNGDTAVEDGLDDALAAYTSFLEAYTALTADETVLGADVDDTTAAGDYVAEQLAVFGELGFSDVIIRTMMGVPQEEAVRSIELAGEVARALA